MPYLTLGLRGASSPSTNFRRLLGAIGVVAGTALVIASFLGFAPPSKPSLVSETAPGLSMRIDTTGEALPPAAPAQETAAGKQIELWTGGRIYLVEPSTWTERSRAAVSEALSLLPSDVRSRLGNPALGPMFVSVNREGRTLTGAQPYQRAANFYSTNEGRNEVVLFTDQSVRTVLHELGHAYNLRGIPAGSYAQVFLDDEMQSFLKAAGWRVVTPIAELRYLRDHADVQVALETPPIWSRLSREDPLEDFANSFAAYFAAPQELKQVSPARYAWFAARFAAD